MRIAKPILLVAVPVGVIGGLRAAWRFNPGLAFLMFVLLSFITAAIAMVVRTIRRERDAETKRPSQPLG